MHLRGRNLKKLFYRKILLLIVEITSACLDFPTFSRVIAAVTSSVSPNSDCSAAQPDEPAGASNAEQGSQHKSQNAPVPRNCHGRGKPGCVLAANNRSGISTVTSSHPVNKPFACQVPLHEGAQESCRANSSVSKNICRFPVHNSIATDKIFPERQQDVLYKNTYLSTGNMLERRKPLTRVSNSAQQCSCDQQSLMWLVTKSTPRAVKILGSPCPRCQNRDRTTVAQA